MLARSLESEAHDKVLDNNPDRIGSWKCWFLRRGENQSTRRKTYRSKEENQQQTQPTYEAGSRNRTRDTLVGGECSHNCATPAYVERPVQIEASKKFVSESCQKDVNQFLKWQLISNKRTLVSKLVEFSMCKSF